MRKAKKITMILAVFFVATMGVVGPIQQPLTRTIAFSSSFRAIPFGVTC